LSPKRNIFIFIGPPGSGKGSLSTICAQKLGWQQLSTGNLCRKHIANQTDIGKEIDFAIKSGKLVSDNLITDMVIEWFSQESGENCTVILDGYPRTIAQAEAFDQVLRDQFSFLKLHVVRFLLSDDTVVARLTQRYVCQNGDCQAIYSLANGSSQVPKRAMSCDYCSFPLGRRRDDEEYVIRDRLYIYHRHEQELVAFYQKMGQLIYNVSVERPLSIVFEDFKQLVIDVL
jgi:adenylate kinase